MNFIRNILITGGAGFIGSHVVRLFVHKYPEYHIINLDKLTYAGNLANLKDIENQPNYTFVKADIGDFDKLGYKYINIDEINCLSELDIEAMAEHNFDVLDKYHKKSIESKTILESILIGVNA